MPRSAQQRLATVGLPRATAYGLVVVGAAYLVAATYGPEQSVARLAVAGLLAIGYVAITIVGGVLRRRRIGC